MGRVRAWGRRSPVWGLFSRFGFAHTTSPESSHCQKDTPWADTLNLLEVRPGVKLRARTQGHSCQENLGLHEQLLLLPAL